jgi:hypothetical protein
MLHRLGHKQLADSTHNLDRTRRTRGWLVAFVSAAVLALVCGWFTASARADGDPASDVLVTQALFLPADGGIPAAQQGQLAALLRSAQRSGYPIRVALIATQADLGSVTALWRQPQSYAGFLGVELSLVYHGTLLVVMPNGFGLYRAGQPVAAEQAALAGARPPGMGASLAAAALTAIQRLAGASGHPLSLPSATAPPASSSGTGSDGVAAWGAFAVGAALIVVAWTASLRARPARSPRRRRDRVASPHGP